MLLTLPIILSRISDDFHPLFIIPMLSPIILSVLFLKFDCVTFKIKIAYGS